MPPLAFAGRNVGFSMPDRSCECDYRLAETTYEQTSLMLSAGLDRPKSEPGLCRVGSCGRSGRAEPPRATAISSQFRKSANNPLHRVRDRRSIVWVKPSSASFLAGLLGSHHADWQKVSAFQLFLLETTRYSVNAIRGSQQSIEVPQSLAVPRCPACD